MTPAEIDAALDAYAAGIEAELPLLSRIRELTDLQHDCSCRDDVEGLCRAGDAREAVMAELAEIETRTRPVRNLVARLGAQASDRPGYRRVAALRATASETVSGILAVGEETKRLIGEAQQARARLAEALGAGESTLTAYRRVVSPCTPSASLVSARG